MEENRKAEGLSGVVGVKGQWYISLTNLHKLDLA